MVFGYFGYIMVRGFFDRHSIDMIIGAIMALSFAYQFTVLLPRPGSAGRRTSAAWPAGWRPAGSSGTAAQRTGQT